MLSRAKGAGWCRQALMEESGEETRQRQLGLGLYEAEREDATAARWEERGVTRRRVDTRQKPWAQVRREAWAARRLQALVKGRRRPQARGRGSELRREVARRAQRLGNFLVKTLTAWQSSLCRKSAADGVRQWQRQVASDACRSQVEGTGGKARREGMVVALRAMVRSRQLRSLVELCRLDSKLYICVRDWRVSCRMQRNGEEVKMMCKERRDARRRKEARRQRMVVAFRATTRSRRLRSQAELCRLDVTLCLCVHGWRVNAMQAAQRLMGGVDVLKAMVRTMLYRDVIVWRTMVYFLVCKWRLNMMKETKAAFREAYTNNIRVLQNMAGSGIRGRQGKKLKREMEKLEEEKVQLESRVKYLSDWIDDLESQKNECISGRMRKKIARLESAICLLEDKEWRAKRRAKKVRAVFQWQWRWRTEVKAAQVRVLEERWVLAQATERTDTGHLWMQEHGDKLVAKLAVATEGSRCFRGKDMGHGVMLWTYTNAEVKEFVASPKADLQELMHMQWRKECRGLVVNAAGVVARPLHKFFSPHQTGRMKLAGLAGMIVQEATVKLDGMMLFGVVLDGAVEFWTRGGRTTEAVKVTRWVYGQQDIVGATGPVCGKLQNVVSNDMKWLRDVRGDNEARVRIDDMGATGPDYVGLVMAADAIGCTVIFEWVGRQAQIKTKEVTTRLVMLHIRDKVTGRYMQFTDREALAQRFQVECVARVAELEGKTVKSVCRAVAHDGTQAEGVVVQLIKNQGDVPVMLKLKTQWWLRTQPHEYKKWHSEAQRTQEDVRQRRKAKHFQVQELRAVITGWHRDCSPGLLCEWQPVQKVECFQARCGGKRGAIIVSFRTVEDKKKMRDMMQMAHVVWGMEAAYSCRSSSNGWHRVRTWYSNALNDLSENGTGAK